jgi:hypothetical protein
MSDDRNAPATKGDTPDLRVEMRAMEGRLLEALRDYKTGLLKAFYGATALNQQRLTQLKGTLERDPWGML